MEKRPRQPQGFFKSNEAPSLIPYVALTLRERKPEILSTFEAERIMAKMILTVTSLHYVSPFLVPCVTGFKLNQLHNQHYF